MPKQMCFRHVPLERKLVKQSLLLNSTFPHHCNFHSRSTTGVNQRPRTRATLSFSTQSALKRQSRWLLDNRVAARPAFERRPLPPPGRADRALHCTDEQHRQIEG